MVNPTPKIVPNDDGTVSVTFTRDQVGQLLADTDDVELPSSSSSDTTDTVLLELRDWHRLGSPNPFRMPAQPPVIYGRHLSTELDALPYEWPDD